MQEKTVTIANTTYELPTPFLCWQPRDPIEMEVRIRCPEAQMDRFLFSSMYLHRVLMNWKGIINLTTKNTEETVEKVTNAEEIIKIQKAARRFQ